MDGRFETYIRPHRGFAAVPTHDGLTLIVGGWPYAEFEANKKDVEGNFLKMFELAPAFAERVRGAKREAPFAGTAVPNFFRKPYGPGWALVGDAGYNKDPITAQGINDAFRDAEHCATALDQAFSGARLVRRRRWAITSASATSTCCRCTNSRASWPRWSPRRQRCSSCSARYHGNQKAMDDFVQMNAGTISPAQFFSPENVGAIMATAHPEATPQIAKE